MQSDFLFLDYAELKRAKALYEDGDGALSKSVKELALLADEELKRGPLAVTDKPNAPKSGDKHDYMSIGIYWWPNPDTADGLPYIRKDGYVNPEADAEVFDRARLSALCSATGILSAAYFYTQNELYAKHCAKLVTTWFINEATKMNPNLEFGQAIPGRCDGRGIGIIETYFMIEIIDSILLLHKENPDILSDEAVNTIKAWFVEYIAWLIESENGKDEEGQHNNHGVWYDAQVIAFSDFCGKGEQIKKRVDELTKKRIDSQIAPDGSLPEELVRTLSFNYSIFTLRAYSIIAVIAKRYGADLWGYTSPGQGSLKLAFDFMVPYLLGEKAWEWQQVKEPEPYTFLPYLQLAYREFSDEKYMPAMNALRAMDKCVINLRYPLA